MKKLLIIAVLILSAIALTTTANAQFKFASGNEKNGSSYVSVAKEFKNTRPHKNFIKDFPDATDDSWAKTSSGFFVRFTSNGILNHIFLSHRGHLESRIQYYTENDLPAEVRHQVKSTYYDYAITSVKEVSCNNSTAYLVTIENATAWKVIRVVNGEKDIWEEHLKS